MDLRRKSRNQIILASRTLQTTKKEKAQRKRKKIRRISKVLPTIWTGEKKNKKSER